MSWSGGHPISSSQKPRGFPLLGEAIYLCDLLMSLKSQSSDPGLTQLLPPPYTLRLRTVLCDVISEQGMDNRSLMQSLIPVRDHILVTQNALSSHFLLNLFFSAGVKPRALCMLGGSVPLNTLLVQGHFLSE